MIFNNRKLIFVLLMIILVEFLVIRAFLSFSFIFADDTQIYCNSFKELFISPSNGLFISSFFGRLFAVFIPLHMDVHPSFFKSNYFCCIESIIFLIFASILNGILFIKRKINYLYPIGFIFLSSFIFFVLQQQPYLLIHTYEGFFRMLMPPFLFVVLVYMILKNINSDTKFKPYIYILTLLCCISNEFICVSVLFGFILFFLLSLDKVKSTKMFVLSFLPVVVSLLGCFILIKTGAFMRHSENVIDLNYILFILKQIPEFSINYIHHIFFKHSIMYILLFLQIAILAFKSLKDEQTKETVKIIFCFLFGMLVFFYMLIGLGKTHYNEGQYWIVHDDLHVMYNIMLCALNLVLLNLIIKFNLIKESFITVVLFIGSVYFLQNDYIFYHNMTEKIMKPWMVETYKSEKAMRLANAKQKTIILNKQLYENAFNWGFFHEFKDRKENVIYTDSPYITYLNQFEKENKITQNFMFSDEQTFLKSFSENGGEFTEYEISHINFNNLKGINFQEN